MLMLNFIGFLVNKSCYNKNLVLLVLSLTFVLISNTFELDNFSLLNGILEFEFSYLLILLVTFIVAIVLISELQIPENTVCFYVINIFAISLIFMSRNILFITLSLELITLSIIGMYFSPSRKNATLFYFFLSGFATAVLVLSISLNLFVLLLISFSIKLGVAPLHQYAPYLYSLEAKDNTDHGHSSIFYLYTVGKSLLVLMIKILNTKFLVIIGLLNVFIGISNAVFYTNRLILMLVFSSISHIGYLLFSESEFASIFYLIQNIITTLVLVLGLLLVLRNSNSTLNSVKYTGLTKFVGILMICNILSLLGIPPFMGFFGKLFILESLIENSAWSLAVVVIIASIFSGLFYLNTIRDIVVDTNLEVSYEHTSNLKYILSYTLIGLVFVHIDKLIEYSIII